MASRPLREPQQGRPQTRRPSPQSRTAPSQVKVLPLPPRSSHWAPLHVTEQRSAQAMRQVPLEHPTVLSAPRLTSQVEEEQATWLLAPAVR